MLKPAAVILAAGESSRMGSPKALLAYRGTTFLEWLAGLFAEAGLEPLLVVLGHEQERIRTAVKLPDSARVLINEDYKLGQLSSLQVALRSIRGVPPSGIRERFPGAVVREGSPGGALPDGRASDGPGLLVAPVDHPCLSREVLGALLKAFAAEDPDVTVPIFNGRRGHPVIFSARLFPELLQAPLDQGARAVVRRHAVCEVPVADEGVLADVDDPDLYRRWITESRP